MREYHAKTNANRTTAAKAVLAQTRLQRQLPLPALLLQLQHRLLLHQLVVAAVRTVVHVLAVVSAELVIAPGRVVVFEHLHCSSLIAGRSRYIYIIVLVTNKDS